MSKRKSKEFKPQKDRGPTFVGLRPIIEEGKKGKLRKQEKKHKRDLRREDFTALE